MGQGLERMWVREVIQGSSDMGTIARWGRSIWVKGSEGERVVGRGIVSHFCLLNLEVEGSQAAGDVRCHCLCFPLRKPNHRGGAGRLPHCCAIPGSGLQVQDFTQGPPGTAVAVLGGKSVAHFRKVSLP